MARATLQFNCSAAAGSSPILLYHLLPVDLLIKCNAILPALVLGTHHLHNA